MGRGSPTLGFFQSFNSNISRMLSNFQTVPLFYLIRATNGSIVAAGGALCTTKEAKCFPKTAFGFVSCRRQGFRRGRKCGGSMVIPVASSPHENPQTEPRVFPFHIEA